LVPPQITELRNQENAPITQLAVGQTFKIVGTYFGEKPPKLWVEYGTAKGARGKLSLKIDKALPHVGVGGKPSCMDPDSGESMVTAIMPAKLKPEMATGATYQLILDNGQGLAICPFKLE
jgi:hypothetical protein